MKVNRKTLPIDLQERISDLDNAIEIFLQDKNNIYSWSNLRDLAMELVGSINSAQYGFEISKEVADEIREEYKEYIWY